MAPVVMALREREMVDVRVLATAQHRELLDQVLSLFGICPDIDLDIMQKNQSLTELTSRLMLKLGHCFLEERPDVVLAQGDTTTVMVSALAAFYHKIPFGHVEAGLRTGNLFNPFPEEMNRIVTGHITRWHFAPTKSAKNNLLREGIASENIFVTGNTVVDALLKVSEELDGKREEIPDGDKKRILVTAHRRENFGAPFREICRAIKYLADQREDIVFTFPVHPNPNVKNVVAEMLSGHDRIDLVEPMDYLPFVAAMKSAHLILSDSGGVQEEAPALGKPVLVLRNETERPEAVEAGVVKLVGASFDRIVQSVIELLDHPKIYRDMAKGVSPYGDGRAAGRIVKIIVNSNMV